MHKSQKNYKSPPKKHQPRGLTILYEDKDIIVVDKASGLLTVSNEKVKNNTAYYLLTNYVRKGNPKSKNRIFIVHRLDRDTSGLIVFAKNEDSKHYLQSEWREFTKTYVAIVHGILPKKEDIIISYLVENRMHKMYSVAENANGKLAKTGYKVLRESKKLSMLEVQLLTGRKNQIRAHLSEQGCPVVGDKIYGDKDKDKNIKRLALHAASLSIVHPFTKQRMTFEAKIPAYLKTLMRQQ